MKVLLMIPLLAFANVSFSSSIKDAFVSKVMKECSLSKDAASKLATPGRTGNVVKLKLCPQNPVKLSDSCKVSCGNNAGSVVGN